MNSLLFVPFLQGEAKGIGGLLGGDISIIIFPLMIVVFYFFLIRPQKKKAQEQNDFLDNLVKGTKVVTAGGIQGKIVNIDANDIVLLQIAENTKIKIAKSAISVEYTNALNQAPKA